MRKNQIAPSLLNSDCSKITETLELLKNEGLEYLHIDVMDGTFVPDMAFGPHILKDIRPKTDLVLDVHLMIDRPEKIADKFAKNGADIVTFHAEATNHAMKTIQNIKEHGKKAGISINPATSVEIIKPVLSFVDQVLVMTINPGMDNICFIEETCEKIAELAKIREEKNYNFDIQVDGKIDDKTILKCKNAGANIFVSGGFVFGSSNAPSEQIRKLKSLV